MKKAFLAVIVATLSINAHANSFQVGNVTELIVENEMFSFQLDTSNGGIDHRDPKCSTESPLSFKVLRNDFQAQLFDVVMESKRTGRQLSVNGKGDCFYGGVMESVDTIAVGDLSVK